MQVINPLSLSLLSLMLSGVGIILTYNDIFILHAKYYLFLIIGLGVIYLIIKRSSSPNKKADRLMVLNMSVMAALLLTSLINANWKLTNLLSTVILTKISLVILIIVAIYGNFVYMRAEQSYKKKRGNQRIKEEPKQGIIEQLRGGEKPDKNEIMIKLGKSAENE